MFANQCVCVTVGACLHACLHACVRLRVCVCVCLCVCFRQLVLDGQWDEVLQFIQPLECMEKFDGKR